MSEAIMDCQKMKIFRFNKQINNQMQYITTNDMIKLLVIQVLRKASLSRSVIAKNKNNNFHKKTPTKMRHKKDSSTEKANAKKRTSKLVNIQRYHIATYWSIYDLLINEITCKKCGQRK